MKILIINQPLNNRGDESAHKALVRNLHKAYPEATITTLFTNANDDSINQFDPKLENVNYVNIATSKYFVYFMLLGLRYNLYFLWKIHPTIKKISEYYITYDEIICAPGGICMGGFQNWTHLFFLQLAKLYHKDLIYYGRSFGPFPTKTHKNRIFKNVSIRLLNYFTFLSIRDNKTEHLAQQLGINYVKTLDTAFLDQPNVTLPNNIQEQISDKFIVFVPNLLIWHYKYKNQISSKSLIQFYSEIVFVIKNKYPKHKIILLPQTFNYGTYLGDDINFFNELSASINNPDLVVIDDIYSSDIQQTIISKSEFVIGARYHSIVFAINNNKPFIALSYEHKIAGMLNSLNKDDSMVDITNISDNVIKSKALIEEIKQKMSHLSSDTKVHDQAKAIAFDCFGKLLNAINKK